MSFEKLSKGAVPFARTQDDIIRASTPATPETYEEDVAMPGLLLIHEMGESELVAFFSTALRSRGRNVSSIELTLGDTYKQTEVVTRLPGSDSLFSKSTDEIARILTMALAADKRSIGFRAVVELDKAGNPASKVYLKLADKPTNGPEDTEFAPRLRLTYRPYHS